MKELESFFSALGVNTSGMEMQFIKNMYVLDAEDKP
jgi:hypothetical protein